MYVREWKKVTQEEEVKVEKIINNTSCMHKGKRRTDTICKHVAKAAKRGDLQRDIFLASNPSVEERLRNALDVLFNSALLDN